MIYRIFNSFGNGFLASKIYAPYTVVESEIKIKHGKPKLQTGLI